MDVAKETHCLCSYHTIFKLQTVFDPFIYITEFETKKACDEAYLKIQVNLHNMFLNVNLHDR